MRIWLPILCLCFLSHAWAEGMIFCCVDSAEVVAFQDRPCADLKTQHVLSDVHTYPFTSIARVDDPLEALVEARKRANAYKKEQALQKTQKRAEAQKDRQSKQAAEALRRIERRKLRCQSIGEKIKKIEARLKQGCKIKHCLRLKEQLKDEQLKKARYCSDTSS